MEISKKDIKKLSKAIKLALKKKRMTGTDLAKKTGIHKTQISKFIRGSFKRYSSNLDQVCVELQINVIQSSLPENQIDDAISDVWDHSASHAKKLAKLIREVGPLLSDRSNRVSNKF